ncbi:glycerate kinase [Bifidobacterium sp. CP2]|uniref:glycerate kinase n=1 Tax=Bifidobacterium sp. CP2 TaxID=2809025 RepID=UPI001BDBBB98|nr:glycerate kinase [Bifidobacterium sp. CP2]MBT1181124.1 glycerate kinase [Bifidobacterium sp. CP2]
MKFVIAPDSFKHCMTARQAAEAIREGLSRVFPDAAYDLVPMADGGEGTVASLVDATGGVLCGADVLDPLQRPIRATYGMLGDGHTAVIEMAEASGIQHVDAADLDPLTATTYGTGQLIRAALDDGARRIILGIGGSATNDGGAGMAESLGVRLLDAAGRPIPRGGGALGCLARIDVSGIDPRIKATDILVASDVTNPLTGPTGASVVFGPQKGATSDMVETLDRNLRHYADVIRRCLGRDVERQPGAGAAGGLGAGLLAFTQATMRSGAALVAETARLADRAVDADYCLTGEGHIDAQTRYGKTPMGVAQAVRRGNPDIGVIAFAGSLDVDAAALHGIGIDAAFAITPGVTDLAQALADGPANLADAAENVGRVIALGRRR